MSTAAETKLLLSIVTSAELTSIPWEAVATNLNCNNKAARERYRKFKLKFPFPADHKATDSEAQLLLAIVASAQVTGIDWAKVGAELGCNGKAACERYRKFKVRLEKKNGGGGGEQQAVDAGAVKNGGQGKAAGKAANGGGTKKSGAAAKKRKIEEENEDGEEEAATEGGHVGGVNGSAKKRARVVNEDKTEVESVKEESGEDYEGEGPEREDDEFYEAEEVLSGDGGCEDEEFEHEI